MASEEHVLLRVEEGVGVVTLNRPDRLNAVSWEMATDLADLVGCLHESIVHPELGHRFAVARFALGDLVLVMGENQIEPTAVDVERFAEDAPAHGRALDMPARSAGSPGAFP